MTRIRIAPWSVVMLLCLLYTAFVIARNNGDPLALVTPGTRFSQGVADGTEGYDGQFNYYIARDPDSAAQFLDVPAYRFQRILFPAVGRLLAFGQEALIPWAFLAINLAALAAGTWLLEELLIQHGVSRWYALGYGLSLGIFGSVRLSLSEPLAYALVIAAIIAARRERWLWCALSLALAGLTKETTLFFAAGFALVLLLERRVLLAVGLGAAAVLPFALWQIVLYQRLGAFGVGSGGALATSFEIIPFAGVARILTDVPPEVRGRLLIIFGIILIPFVLIPTLWALWRCWRDLRARTWTAYTALLLATAAIMPFVPFSTYREPIGILRFIVGLQIAVILYAAERRNMRALRNSTIWALTVLFAFTLV
jgi:hypothetical protein